MKGATNTIASASASGITRIAVMKQKVANSKSKARKIKGRHCLNVTRKDSRMTQIKGAINVHCMIKRAAVICPTGTLVEANLAATSSNGAVTQKPSISATPARMLSVDGIEDEVFVIGKGQENAC